MTPIVFDVCNRTYSHPKELDVSQCASLAVYEAQVQGGNLDGELMIVAAWKPTPEELAQLNAGNPVFITFISGMPPHFLSTNFQDATAT